MNLVFNEYIQFLKSKGIDLGLKEGYYWQNKLIIKAYDKQGNIHKIARLHIDNNLNITAKKYKHEEFQIESWQETVERNNTRLEQLENEALKVINNVSTKYKDHNIICTISGGKDSSIVEHLLQKNNVKHKLIFNNTSNETHVTYKYIKQNYPNITILSPPIGFYNLIKETGTVPSRFNRFCCSVLKEGVTINQLDADEKILFVMGMRKDESKTRSVYGYEWRNINWKSNLWIGCLPILNFTEEDIWLYILKNNIKINDLYRYGFARVGCTYCPYRSNLELLLTEYFLPKYHERWQQVLENDFIEHGKATVLNCSLQQYLNGAWRGGKVADKPTQEVIEEFAQYKGIKNLEVAKKYFNKQCKCCGDNIKKDEIALSMKYFGRQIDEFYCFKCLSKELNMSKKELKGKCKEFKQQGCSLF